MRTFVDALSGIYAILNEGDPNPADLGKAILEGGVRLVQYRAKNGIVMAHLGALREMTRAHRALLIVNDDWRAALEADADGVHLGPDDATHAQLSAIRAALHGRVLGISCGTPDEARAAQAAGADYIGVGSVYATDSKLDAGAPIGIEGLQRVAAACTVPVAAIGGISLEHLGEVARSGVAMAALLSAFSRSADPQWTARTCVGIWLR